MAQKQINIRVEIDQQTDVEFSEWSRAEGRSKRRHLGILARKLVALRKSHAGDLGRLGLIDAAPKRVAE